MSKIKNTILVVLLTSFVICQKTYIQAGRLIDGITEIPIEMVSENSFGFENFKNGC